MKKFLYCGILVFFCVATLFVSAATKAEKVAKRKQDSLRTLYQDQSKFQKLSNTAKRSLHRKFAAQEKRGKGIVSTGSKKKTRSVLAPTTVVPNVLVNDPADDSTDQDTQSTTAIVLAGPNIVVGFTDTGSLLPGTKHFTGYAHSTDGGATFTDDGLLPDDPNDIGDDGDPVLDRDNITGRVYLATGGFELGEVLEVYRSDDNGVTFGDPVALGFTNSGDLQDKQWLAVDNAAGTGQGNIYVAWRSFGDGIYFSRSIDQGDNWSAPMKLADEGTNNVQGAYVVVTPDHAVHVFWLDQSAGTGTPNIIMTRKSIDQGVSFALPVTVATLTNTGTNGDLSLSGEFLTNSFPRAAANPVSGHIYVTWNDVAGSDDADVFFSMSTDGGATWSVPFNVSNLHDTSDNDDFLPTIAVTPDGSKLFIAWYDRELDPNNALIDRFGIIANTSPVPITFGDQFRISDSNWPVAISQDPQNEIQYMGDYDQAAADNSFFYTVWADNRGSNAIHDYQPDVRFAKIPVSGPGGILFAESSTIDDSNGNDDTVVDFNECIDLNVALKNLGTSNVTVTSATLTTSTPEVTVISSTAAYSNIAPATSVSNSTAFRFQTSVNFECGTNIEFDLTVVTAADGTFVFPITIQTGADGSAGQFDNNTATPVPDVTVTDIPITVSGFTGNIGKVTLSMYLTHTYDSDLDISLIAPDGVTKVDLSTNNGVEVEDFGTACSPESNRTTFDDDATDFIADGTAPFVGSFRPQQSLSAFNGLTGAAVNGVWTLRIKDETAIDSGTLNCVSLFITPANCTDGGGELCLTCTYEETFNDGTFDWDLLKPAGSETGGFLVLTPTGKKAIVISPSAFAGCQLCSVIANLQFSGGVGSKAWLYTHRLDKSNQIEVLFKVEQGRIVVKQRFNGQIVKKGKASFVLTPNTLYNVRLQYDGTTVTLSIGGSTVLSFTPVGTIPLGVIGFASKDTTTSVDHVCVQ